MSRRPAAVLSSCLVAAAAFGGARVAEARRSKVSVEQADAFTPLGLHGQGIAAAAATALLGPQSGPPPLGAVIKTPWSEGDHGADATPPAHVDLLSSPAAPHAEHVVTPHAKSLAKTWFRNFERDIEKIRRKASPEEVAEVRSRRGPCKYGSECMHLDCPFEHPPLESFSPRRAHAQVVVLRSDAQGEWHVLLHRENGHKMPGGQFSGHLSFLKGAHRNWEYSRDTAIREAFQEAGILDVGHLKGALLPFAGVARTKGARAPRTFEIFNQTDKTDWWVLVLAGPGTFGATADDVDRVDPGPIEPLLKWLGGSSAPVPVPGHAWVPVKKAMRMPSKVPALGLKKRLRQAVHYACQCDQKRRALV